MGRRMLDPLQWVRTHDPGLGALRRAGRAAVVMPAVFAVSVKVVGNPILATFAAFGSFALLLLVEFGGSMRDRLQAQLGLAAAGAVFICIGTLVSRSPWSGAAAMAVVGFGVLFAGVVSSVLAGATLALLLAFILPVSLAGPDSSIPDRLAGWALASAASLLAIAFLWPAPARNPLRGAAIAACRALAARLRSDAAYLTGGADAPSTEEHEAAVAAADDAVAGLRRVFFATPYRPTGLTTAARAVVRLVDELSWVHAIVLQTPTVPSASSVNAAACAVKGAAAEVLERGADLLEGRGSSPGGLQAAEARLSDALAEVERDALAGVPPPAPGGAPADPVGAFVTSLDPGFRAQELSFAVLQIAANVDLAAAADRRRWVDRLLGRRPAGAAGALAVAQQRAASHAGRNSVWLHNSVRGAVGLGLAVLLAQRSGVQHTFWVVLGTLSVLRSNALSTGQNVVRGLLGTAVGFVAGAGLILLVGTNTTVLWLLLAPAILFAGFAPAAISFAVGQAAFTLTLVILYNILQPAGWRVGLVRVEDIGFGCAVSLAVGLLFWPRGAGSELGRALAAAYVDSARYLARAVTFGMGRCDPRLPAPAPPVDEATRAAAAARRLDDAFRGYLAERGAKPVSLAGVTGLLTGAAGLRLAADAVLDLWQRDDGQAGGDRAEACRQVLSSTEAVAGWYDRFAAGLTGRGEVPEPLAEDGLAASRLVEAVRQDLRDESGGATAVAVRMIWTGDHLDAARRLQAGVADPARVAALKSLLAPSSRAGSWLGLPLAAWPRRARTAAH